MGVVFPRRGVPPNFIDSVNAIEYAVSATPRTLDRGSVSARSGGSSELLRTTTIMRGLRVPGLRERLSAGILYTMYNVG